MALHVHQCNTQLSHKNSDKKKAKTKEMREKKKQQPTRIVVWKCGIAQYECIKENLLTMCKFEKHPIDRHRTPLVAQQNSTFSTFSKRYEEKLPNKRRNGMFMNVHVKWQPRVD